MGRPKKYNNVIEEKKNIDVDDILNNDGILSDNDELNEKQDNISNENESCAHFDTIDKDECVVVNHDDIIIKGNDENDIIEQEKSTVDEQTIDNSGDVNNDVVDEKQIDPTFKVVSDEKAQSPEYQYQEPVLNNVRRMGSIVPERLDHLRHGSERKNVHRVSRVCDGMSSGVRFSTKVSKVF